MSISVFAIAGVGIFSFIIAKRAILFRSFEQLTAAREAKKASIEEFINNKIDGAMLSASSIAMDRIIAELTKNPCFEVTDKAVNVFLRTGEYHALTIIFDSTRYAYAPIKKYIQFTDSVDPDLEIHFKKMFGKVRQSQQPTVFDYVKYNGLPVISIAAPAYVDREFRAVVVLTIALQHIDKILLEQTPFGGMGATGETYLVGNDLVMRSTSRFDSLSAMRTVVSSTAAKEAIAGIKNIQVTEDYRGVEVLSSYSPINVPDLNWAILSEIDQTEIMVPVRYIRNEVILISAIVLLFLVLMLLWISKRLTRPLKGLRSLARTIASGDYGKTIQVSTADEVGQLAEALNTMSLEINDQREKLKNKNKEIIDSITYAKRIQTGLLPSQRLIESLLNDSFVLYVPKHTVSGDFYYLGSEGGQIIIAVGDCTGHGVPGAFISGICLGALQRTIKGFGITKPSKILDKLNEIVIDMFSQSEMDIRDGMDISVCCIDLQGKILQYAGANNALYLVQNGAFREIKADRQPIGTYYEKKPFTNHEVQLQGSSAIYMFSDGYSDQLGGPNEKKFMRSRFRQLLLDIHQQPMSKQKFLLEEELEKWKGDRDQMDDICVFGVSLQT